jgi:hypothetical protein
MNLPHPFYQNPFPGMTAQATYDYNFALPWPGTPGDGSQAQDFITGINETVYLPFGVLVSRDVPSGDNHVKLPAAEGDLAIIAGIVVRTGAMETRRDGYPPSYAPKIPVNIQKQGRAYVAPETAVVKGGAVYCRVVANSPLVQLGALRADNDGGNAVLVPNMKWGSSQASPSQPALVEFNFLGQ